ncbi:ionotropic receptor 25a-like [Dermacentor variabilis]|uniref:ionotropic receptor 25a-like n=1 Tax=Dermacentor variabilis TaxID=34621 RepID=UPI003F5C25EC
MTLAAGEKGAVTAAFLAAALVAATAQNTLHFVVAVEKGNDVAKLMITETLRMTTRVPLTYSLVELDPEEVNVAEVCNAIFADPKPHVLIDAVRAPGSTVDKLSTAVRETARRMGLPTLSLTYGAHNDYPLSGWDRLTALEREFLVHVTPPGEIYTQAIRDLCKKMDLSAAGIIYDSSVIIDHKYARLLENIPTPHIMREVDGTEYDFKRNAELIHSMDISNFFILGRGDTLNQALELAHRNDWDNWEFGWFLISRENYAPNCSVCSNVTFITVTPQLTNPELLAEAMKYKDFNVQTEQIICHELAQLCILPPQRLQKTSNSVVDAAFYIDVTSMVIRAAAEERASKRMPPDLEYPTCTDMNLTSSMLMERQNITLRTTMMQMEYAGPFGPIVIREKKNGYQEISMSIQRVNAREAKRMNFMTIAKWTYKDPEGKLLESPGEDLRKYAAVTVFRVTTVVLGEGADVKSNLARF